MGVRHKDAEELEMRLILIAINNIERRKTKAIILAAGLSIAVLATVTLFTITVAMRENIDGQLDEFGTNILIIPKYKEIPLSYAGINVSSVDSQPAKELSVKDVSLMRTIPNRQNLNIISPKLVGPVKISGQTALVVGIQFANELRIKTWWQYTGKQPKGKQDAVANPRDLVKKRAVAGTNYKRNEVIAGAVFAKKFKLKPGSKISVNGLTFKVASVLKPAGSSDDNVFFMNLTKTQKILNKPRQISFIEANAYCLDCPLPKLVRQLSKKLPYAKVLGLRAAVAQKEQTLAVFTAFSIASSAIMLIVAALVVFTTMTASVKERTREIGIFRAVGFRKKHIIAIIMSEVVLLSIAGGLTGYLTGFIVSKMLVPVIAPQAKGFYFNPSNINVVVLGISVLAAFLIGAFAALLPAVRAANKDPASALRFI